MTRSNFFGLFCCVITGFMNASSNDVAPYIQGATSGLAKGVAWSTGGTLGGVVAVDMDLRLNFSSGITDPESCKSGYFWGGLIVGGLGSACGVAHGLKKIVVDKEYLSGTGIIGGSLALPTLYYVWLQHQHTQRQIRPAAAGTQLRPENEE
jgi:hypothetical protein